MRYPLPALLVCFVILGSCLCHSQDRSRQNVDILDIVWNTMNERYFDPDLGGIDWKAQYERYKPIIEACETDDSLYDNLNEMLFKLEVSHLGVASPEEVNEVGDPQLFLDGTLGIDVRYLSNKAVVISVDKKSSAAEASLKPGFLLLQVNGKTVEEIVSDRKADPTPPFNDRNLHSMITQDIIRELYGEPGESVTLVYEGEKGEPVTVELELKERSERKETLMSELPDIYASAWGHKINDRVAYIRFNVFHPAILDSVLGLVDEHIDMPGLIIDIRGNPGGDFHTRRTIAAKFVSKRTLCWIYHSREGIREVYLDPPERSYEGEVVILIDEMSGSSSEEFSGAMQAIGRATIIGKRTAGKVLTMEVVPLPGGAVFVYPDSQTRTSQNEILEGRGVIPDVEVELTQPSLEKGRDLQLEAAIDHLLKD